MAQMAMPKGNCKKVCHKNANGQNDVTQVHTEGYKGTVRDVPGQCKCLINFFK